MRSTHFEEAMIRKLDPKDAVRMHEWMQDRAVTKNFQTNFGSFTMETVCSFIEKSSKQTLSDTTLNFAIVNETDEYMGTVSLKNVNLVDKNAEYAIVTRSEAHGKGFARAASEDIMRVAFEELGLEKVYLYVSVKNVAANKFYQKFGFKEEGVFRKHTLIDGELTDIRWYSILREEYLSR